MSADEDRCPICGHDLTIKIGAVEHGVIAEQDAFCHHCKQYIWETAYGGTRVTVGEKQFVWHYETPEAKIRDIEAQIRVELFEAREKRHSEACEEAIRGILKTPEGDRLISEEFGDNITDVIKRIRPARTSPNRDKK